MTDFEGCEDFNLLNLAATRETQFTAPGMYLPLALGVAARLDAMKQIKRLAHQFVSFPFIEAYRVKAQLSACRRQVEEAGVWFVDIPRTGSTSLKLALEQRFGSEFGKEYLRETGKRTRKIIHDHRTAIEVKILLTAEVWRRLFTFSIVRNPWDRCYSFFRYRIAAGHMAREFSFFEYLRLLEQRNTRSRCSPFVYRPFFMQMCDFVLDENDNQLVNYVGRFEQREEFAIVLKEKIGLDFSDSPRAEVLGKPGDYRKAYCNEGVEIVARIYRDDIERFQYDF